MEDYQGNANKNKPKPKPDKAIERVVVGEVIIQKKSVGRKFKDLFIEADLKSVATYVFMDVLVPAARNMIVDGASRGVERLMYGETAVRNRPRFGPTGRATYPYNNSPINRDRDWTRPNSPRTAPPINTTSRSRRDINEVIIPTREEAENVLERLNDVIDGYEVATVGDFYGLVGLDATFVDEKWGWVYLADTQIRQVREGFFLDLPAPEPIS